MTLQDWTTPFLQPVILVIASDTVEDACAKNGLTFVELLKPFAAQLDGVKGKGALIFPHDASSRHLICLCHFRQFPHSFTYFGRPHTSSLHFSLSSTSP